jgi:hypothetical protein
MPVIPCRATMREYRGYQELEDEARELNLLS